MAYTLWSKGQLLGSVSALPAGVVLPGLAPGAVAGFFKPAPAFATAAAPLATLAAIPVRERLKAFAAVPRESDLEGLPQHEVVGRVRAALEASADAQRFLELQRGIADLALELHDDAGASVPAPSVNLVSLVAESGLSLDAMRDDGDASGEGMPEYLLVAQNVGVAS